jgi:sarcosine oxidase, subunit beta
VTRGACHPDTLQTRKEPVMTEHSEIVVVGGGIFGMSTALHLLRAGATSVRVLERDGVFQGTTGAGGGFLAPWTTLSPLHGETSPMLPVERYGMEFYADIAAAGHDIDYRHNGVLWVTASEESRDMNEGLAFDVADPGTRFLRGADIDELTAGVVDGSRIAGAQFMPSGAQITTSKLGPVMTGMIEELGGIVETRRPVDDLLVENGRVVGVRTPHGDIGADHVVVAAGAWSGALLEKQGFFLPTVPQVTSRIVTDDLGLPDTTPVMMIVGTMPDEPGGGTVLWVRWHDGGLLWGGMYTCFPRDVLVGAPVPDRLDELPTDGVLENLRVAAAADFIPALGRPTSIRVKHGAPCYTPDDLALLGPVPGIDGLHVVGGDNEIGVTHGPGFGRVVADTLLHGHSEFADITPWRVDRFGDRFTDQAATLRAVSEQFDQLVGDRD